ncbi:MAG: Xylose isomerase domain protein barrel [Verrucomicrobiales bacterium]|nr:Xylose isomerase domain protein barrel [Verrucomicrobiales bacterium]
MLREIRELGFEYAELSHGIRITLLPGIFEAVDAGEIKISSLHNFCPLPMGVTHAAPNLFKFSSTDKREWESAYRHSVKTIETAARVNAPVVVLHMGRIDMRIYTDKLVEMLERGERETEKFQKLCDAAYEKREDKKEKAVKLANQMLERLIAVAEPLGIKLGVENREALEEIPIDSDFRSFFKEFTSPTVIYWHDCGHAQIKENLGFINHRFHLESMVPRLGGFHVHDVKLPARDHCAPGTGVINYTELKASVKPEHIKVFELHPSVPVEEVNAGVAHIKSIWGPE